MSIAFFRRICGADPVRGCGTRFSLRLVTSFAGLVIAGAVGLAAVVGLGTREQDLAASAASARLAATAIQARNAEIGRVVRDYALWSEAYRNIHPTVNVEWVYDGANYGSNIYDSLGYEYVFIIDAAGRTSYAVDRGQIVPVEASEVIGHGLERLLRQARSRGGRDGQPAVGAVTVSGRPALAAAVMVFPHDDTVAGATTETAPLLLFVDVLDEEVVRKIAADYLLNDLEFELALSERPDHWASLPLVGADGGQLGWLRWRPERPGTVLLHSALPWLGAAATGLLLLIILTGRSLRRAAVTVAASEERFRDVATSSSDWIFETDRELRLTYVSGRFEEVTGIPVHTVLGRPLVTVLRPIDSGSSGWTSVAGGTARTPLRDLRATVRDAGGRQRTLRLACLPILAADGGIDRFRGAATDITDEVEAKARAEFLSLHDPLTGLPNRLMFAERLAEVVAVARVDARPSAALYLDLDKFKEVNDTLGHPVGDRLLCDVTARLRALVRSTDMVARLGGDEFAILLSGCGRVDEAEAFCRRALAAIAEPFDLEGQAVHVNASIGVAVLPADADEADLAMRCADLALYQAKSEGRGTFRFYAPAMNSELQRRRDTERELRRALEAQELELHFQPKCRADTAELAGFEALVRWRHPERGLVMPGGFIDVAERTGLILPIGEWVLEEACMAAARWPGYPVSVNLSPVQLRSPRLITTVRRALDRSGLEPSRLELEITESFLVHDLEGARGVLLEMKALGIRLAMDDFGTGYSSLSYLQSLPFDRIKIDRSFVARLGGATKAEAIVRAIVTLAHGLGIATTAEGVEDADQLRFLREIGCDELQGYLFGRAMEAGAIDATITTAQERVSVGSPRSVPIEAPADPVPVAG
ncbi:MAG TPA: EAL domain-containing protein [Geminicoccus sp.]|uniref:bifunctional diguanylate cyclase/phosphodiesterase n=1 Tax=Geminicoccus sp. TaxID=2024832 RepID=UPI002C39F801|nr:EAL domain-containing protein [Geminicoccus sp.]HWL70146.1 EAL domain-containing protein [Geminicoccus sp.]